MERIILLIHSLEGPQHIISNPVLFKPFNTQQLCIHGSVHSFSVYPVCLLLCWALGIKPNTRQMSPALRELLVIWGMQIPHSMYRKTDYSCDKCYKGKVQNATYITGSLANNIVSWVLIIYHPTFPTTPQGKDLLRFSFHRGRNWGSKNKQPKVKQLMRGVARVWTQVCVTLEMMSLTCVHHCRPWKVHKSQNTSWHIGCQSLGSHLYHERVMLIKSLPVNLERLSDCFDQQSTFDRGEGFTVFLSTSRC